MLAENINAAGLFEVRVDAQFLLISIARPARAKRGINGDLWHRIFDARDSEPQRSILDSRVWSRLAGKELEIGCPTLFDMRGKTFADEMASRAAKRVELFPSQANAGQATNDRGKLGGFPPRTPIHQKTRQQKIKSLLETRATAGHAIKRGWCRREFFSLCKVGKACSLPKWKQELSTCSALLALHDDRWVGAVSCHVLLRSLRQATTRTRFGHGGAMEADEETCASTQRQRSEIESPEEHRATRLVLRCGVVLDIHETSFVAGHRVAGHRVLWTVWRMEHVSTKIADPSLLGPTETGRNRIEALVEMLAYCHAEEGMILRHGCVATACLL